MTFKVGLVRFLNHSRNAKFHSRTISMFGSNFKLGMDNSRNKLILQTSLQIERNRALREGTPSMVFQTSPHVF